MGLIKRHANIIFFVGGFLFDSLTMTRIDSAVDLIIQLVYLIVITVIVIAQVRAAHGLWTPSGRLARYWPYETEVLHFCYGGLLSGFIVFYFKSTSFSRSFVFLTLIAVLMVANEMPQIRKWGTQLRLGLYAFCIVSYLNYLLPVLVGRMGWHVFLLGWAFAVGVTFQVLKKLASYSADSTSALKQMGRAPAIVLLLVLTLYSLKLIPPVPLSLQHLGIYRNVEKTGSTYVLTKRVPKWYAFWRTDNRVFPARAGDEIYSFVSVFAPRRFSHSIYIRWSFYNPVKKEWLTADRLPIALAGGRKDGFRGFTRKEHYEPGNWRVEVETEDGRVLGSKSFVVEADASTGERRLKNFLL